MSRVLLDTHAFIWFDSEPEKLPQKVLEILLDTSTEILVSVASVWEMQIKYQLGKLSLSLSIEDLIEAQRRSNGVVFVDISLEHVLALRDLPPIHKDPFDRMLVCQSIIDSAPVVTADSIIPKYGIDTIW